MTNISQLIERNISSLAKTKNKIVRSKIFSFFISTFHNGDNLYHLACIKQDINLLQLAIDLKQDINLYNKNGLLPIHILLREMIDTRPHRRDNSIQEVFYVFNENFWQLFLSQNPNLNLFWLKRPLEIKTVNKGIFGYPSEVAYMLFKDVILIQDDDIVSENYAIYEKIFTELFSKDQKDFSEKLESIKIHFPDDSVDYFKFPSISSFMISYIAAENQWLSVLPLLQHPHFYPDYPDNQNGNTALHIIFGRIHSHINKTSKATIQQIILKIINNPNFSLEQISKQNFTGVSPVTLLRKDSAFVIDFFKMIMFEEQLYAQTEEILKNKTHEDDLPIYDDDNFKL